MEFKLRKSMGLFSLSLVVFLVVSHCSGGSVKVGGTPSTLTTINDDNWNQILEGEWMVEFFAPWCPACRSLQPVWEEFASWSADLGIGVGQVDITSSPGLSGRFMITALPTIFHIKEGVFRQYKGPRSKEEFLGFVEEKKWESLEPVSSWQSPSSIPMTVVSQFYKISMGLRNVMNVMLEEYGIPTWAAYLAFGVATILIGLVLGLILVCIIDCVYPPSVGPPPQIQSPAPGQKKEKDSDDEFTEEIQDESQEEDQEETPDQDEDEDEPKEKDTAEDDAGADGDKDKKDSKPSARRRRRD